MMKLIRKCHKINVGDVVFCLFKLKGSENQVTIIKYLTYLLFQLLLSCHSFFGSKTKGNSRIGLLELKLFKKK